MRPLPHQPSPRLPAPREAVPATPASGPDLSGQSAASVLLLQRTIGNRAVRRLLDPGAPALIQRDDTGAAAAPPAAETWAQVHQRVLKGLIEIVTANKLADEEKRLGKFASYEEEPRRVSLRTLIDSVPDVHARRLHDRLEPGAETDDFANYLKWHFPNTRPDALGILRRKYLALPAPAPAPAGNAPAKKPPTEIKDEAIGKETAGAACKLPTDIQFAGVMSEGAEGLKLNVDYWIVEYVVVRAEPREEKRFVSSSSQTAWQQAEVFLKANEAWKVPSTKVYVNIKVGKNGASGAVNDAFSIKSSALYALDCFVAATLSQLYGLYLAYPADSRDTAFDRDHNSFEINLKPPGEMPATSISGQFDAKVLDAPVALSKKSDIKSVLKPGDQVPITNPYFPVDSPWFTENTIFIGKDEFWGHPLGRVTIDQYAETIAKKIPRGAREQILSGKSDEDEAARLKQYVLEHSYIKSYSRPRSRSVAPPQ